LALLLGHGPAALAGKSSKAEKAAGESTVDKTAGDGDETNLLYIEGRQLVLDGRNEEAAPLLEKALKADPENAFVNHQLAEVYLRLGNFERAEILGKKAVDKDPSNLEYHATLGGILATLKRYPEAKDQYNKIVELDPTNQKAPLLLGILEAESGQLDQGAKILTKAIDDSSDNYMAYFYRAKIYLEMEDMKKAKADLDKCLTIKPSFVEAGTALGLLYERLGETEEAIKTYNRIQGSGRYKKRLAQLYLQKNEFEKALEELIEYEKVEPDDYGARVKIALIYFEIKKYDLALDRFKAILKEQPQADNVRFYLAAVYEELKQYDKALTEFKSVTKESAFYREAMLHVGFIYKEQEKIKEGLEFSKKLLTQSPDIVEFYDMHASFFEYQKDFKKALAVVGDGLKRYPTDEKLLYFEGALYDKLGDRKHGVENMKKILASNANNAHALNFLGYTYAEMGENLDEAESLVGKALTLRPNDGYIEDSMGWVLFKKGKLDQALERLQKAATLQPEEPIIFEHMGDVYMKKNEAGKAVDSYKKAISLSTKKDKEMAKKLEDKIAAAQKDPRAPTGNTKQ
jgi:tetratricopeptide (TPR) repeat protein